MASAHLRHDCRVVQHDAFDVSRHRQVGTIPGTQTPALVEANFVDQDVRITTGFIEPHFFAGFSGGPKMVAPGLAALETVLDLHSASRIAHPCATWGITEDNPVHAAVRAIAAQVGVSFNLDVTLNRDHAITNVFMVPTHFAGIFQLSPQVLEGFAEDVEAVALRLRVPDRLALPAQGAARDRSRRRRG